MQLKYILLTVVIILVRSPFFLCRVLYHVQVASRGRGVKREENRKFVMKEARTTIVGKFDFAGATYQLKVQKIFPEVKEGRFEVDLDFEGQEPNGIRRGQTLHIRLQLSEMSKALLLARGGFYQDTGGNWVYVLDKSGEYAVKRSIKLGRQNPQYFEVLSGLQSGERVVTSSYENFGNKDRLVLK